MKIRCLICIAGLLSRFAFGEVTITNLAVAQRPGTKLVDITYDVSSTITNEVYVSLTVSNGLAEITVKTLNGDIGPVFTGVEKMTVWDAGADWNGNLAALTYALKAHEPLGMVQIPIGVNSGTDPDYGAYSLTNTAPFYMDAAEVTKAQWDTVYSWALTNGYQFDNAGSGKAPDHPVQTVSWYDCVKWCNARSQKEGLDPCYTTNGVIYKTGQNSNVVYSLSANGYRLPTAVEWTYAARGGLSSTRFPWGDTITHSQANYYSTNSYSYDISPTRGYHPSAGTNSPRTMTVNSFAANGYGLYGMAANVREWCWDMSGSARLIRGGGWNYDASRARFGYAYWGAPDYALSFLGFRTVCR